MLSLPTPPTQLAERWDSWSHQEGRCCPAYFTDGFKNLVKEQKRKNRKNRSLYFLAFLSIVFLVFLKWASKGQVGPELSMDHTPVTEELGSPSTWHQYSFFFFFFLI